MAEIPTNPLARQAAWLCTACNKAAGVCECSAPPCRFTQRFPVQDAVKALQGARHALVTSHNLRVTDLDVATFDGHIANGSERGSLEWMVNHEAEIASIDAALAQLEA